MKIGLIFHNDHEEAIKDCLNQMWRTGGIDSLEVFSDKENERFEQYMYDLENELLDGLYEDYPGFAPTPDEPKGGDYFEVIVSKDSILKPYSLQGDVLLEIEIVTRLEFRLDPMGETKEGLPFFTPIDMNKEVWVQSTIF